MVGVVVVVVVVVGGGIRRIVEGAGLHKGVWGLTSLAAPINRAFRNR